MFGEKAKRVKNANTKRISVHIQLKYINKYTPFEIQYFQDQRDETHLYTKFGEILCWPSTNLQFFKMYVLRHST